MFNVHADCWHCSVCGGNCPYCDGDGMIRRLVWDDDVRRNVPVDVYCPSR